MEGILHHILGTALISQQCPGVQGQLSKIVLIEFFKESILLCVQANHPQGYLCPHILSIDYLKNLEKPCQIAGPTVI